MRLPLTIHLLVAMAAVAPSFAGEHLGHKHGALFCPRCSEPCYPTVTKGTETKTCWDVECKAICIPRVTFPWEHGWHGGKGKDGCVEPKCGRVKYVNKLMKCEYECSVCKYSWDISEKGDGKGDGAKSREFYYEDPAPAAEGAPAPVEAAPAVPPPPPVEARRRLDQRAPLPVRYQTVTATTPGTRAPDKPSIREIFTSFFNK